MLGFSAISELALGEQPRARAGANFKFSSTAYTYGAANFSFAPGGAVTPATVTGVGAVTLSITVAAAGTHAAPAQQITGTGAVTLPVTVAAVAGHGVAGSGAATIAPTVAAQAGHGVAGAGAATIAPTVAAAAAHGVRGDGAATLGLTAAAVAVHQRFELRGEVRQGGILVNRRVRAYRRDTGAFVAEADTVAGRFAIRAGFAPIEHYIVPIHLDDAATDWTPPVANRVLGVLAQDV